MIRLPRFVLGVALVVVVGAACSGGPSTAPAPNTMSPAAGPLMVEGDTATCRGGYNVQNGKAC